MRIAILGPLAVTDDGGADLPVAGARLRTLLIRLALDAGRFVRAEALIDAVWGEDPPAGAANALQTLVSRLRRALPAGSVDADATGYRVCATVDADEFAALVADARGAAPEAAARLLGAALGLWRGHPDLDFAPAAAARLDETHAAAVEDWLAARLAGPEPRTALPEIEALAAAHPLRERPHVLLVEALAATGRTADAIAVVGAFRQRLADQLGLDPSPALAAAHARLLAEPPVARGNLRQSLTSFVGRENDVAAVTHLVREHRLVTLVGPGGAGKTRLATEVARGLADGYAGGAWIVELAPVRDPDGVAAAIGQALQARDIRFLDLTATDPWDRLVDAVGDKDMLVVLDNCEHLVDAAARAADGLLAACPGVRMLATSREPLAITGEALYGVGPLALPSPADPASAASVRLFVDRARAVRPGFALDAANTGAVVEICRRLDGIPLAVELACARLRTLPVEAIAARLDDRFRLLTGGSRTALPRHQTLQAAVDWSWDLLEADERHLAARFSVFLDGATADTVVDLLGGLDTLAALVDKSFVVLGDDGRYRMLETIRAYAAERLADSGDAPAARDAHARWFRDLAARADSELRGPRQGHWLRQLAAERDNLTAAMRWAIDCGDAPTAVRLAGSLGWYWLVCDYHLEAVGWLGQALALPGDVPDEDRALALAHFGVNRMITDEVDEIQRTIAEARSLGSNHPLVALSGMFAGSFGDDREIAEAELPAVLAHPDPWVHAMGVTVRGILAMFAGDPEAAERDLLDALSRFDGLGDQWACSTLSGALGELRAARGDERGAIEAIQAAADLADGLGVDHVAAQALLQLSLERARRGDLPAARDHLARAKEKARTSPSHAVTATIGVAEAEIARRSGDLLTAHDRYAATLASVTGVRGLAREIQAGLLSGLTMTELDLGRVEEARAHARAIIALAPAGRERYVVMMAALASSGLAMTDGDPARAARLIGVADMMRGMPERGNPDVDRVVAAARAALGPAYDDAYRAGFELPVDAAMAAVRDEV